MKKDIKYKIDFLRNRRYAKINVRKETKLVVYVLELTVSLHLSISYWIYSRSEMETLIPNTT